MTKEESICPVCGNKNSFLGDGHCSHCGWCYTSQANLDDEKKLRDNDLPFNEFRFRYLYIQGKNPTYRWINDGFPQLPKAETFLCPVCQKTEFQPFSWEDLYLDEGPDDAYCSHCGWLYCTAQLEDPEYKNPNNGKSLLEHRQWFTEKLRQNPDFDFFDDEVQQHVPTPHPCPVCGKFEFSDNACFDICPYCGWEDDGSDQHEGLSGGANDLDYPRYKERYQKYLSVNSKYRWENDGKPKF